jgi:hypothetical protein
MTEKVLENKLISYVPLTSGGLVLTTFGPPICLLPGSWAYQRAKCRSAAQTSRCPSGKFVEGGIVLSHREGVG